MNQGEKNDSTGEDDTGSRQPPPGLGGQPLAPAELVSQQNLVDRWLAWLGDQVALQQLAELTRDGYRAKIRYWLDYLELVARTDRPTPATVQDYVASVIEGEHEPATVNAYLNAVKSFYRWCETGDLY